MLCDSDGVCVDDGVTPPRDGVNVCVPVFVCVTVWVRVFDCVAVRVPVADGVTVCVPVDDTGWGATAIPEYELACGPHECNTVGLPPAAYESTFAIR